MRALAALVVFVNHAYAQAWDTVRSEHPGGIFSPFQYFMVAGHLSVTVFIVISGFCLALPIVAADGELRGGTLSFFKRRARRILPPYYGAVALCLALIWTIIGTKTGTLWDFPILVKEPGTTKIAIISHLLLVQDLFATSKINYVFWSIAVEWHIYFFFPLFVWAYKRFGPAVTVATVFALGYALRIGFSDTRVARASPHFLGMFVLGMLAAHIAYSPRDLYARARQRFPWAWVAASAFLVLCGLVAWWGIEPATHRFYILDVPAGTLAFALLVLSSRSETLLHRLLSWKPLAAVGVFSYSVYLIHAPLLQVAWQYVLHPLGVTANEMFAFLVTAGLAFVTGTSYLFFRVFEHPFMQSANKSARRQRDATPMPVT
jgi:peptidoglycan/LPS O-acetylase OafA/YrhL